MSGLDWPSIMRSGLRGLGLKPDEFWDLTPVEFLTMLGIDGGQAAVMGRDGLAALCREFPDEPNE